MVDTPSTILLTREQSTGSNTNLWGGYLVITQRMTEQAMKGYQTLAVTGNATISWTNYTTGNTGQCAHLKLTGTLAGAATLVFPSYTNRLVIDSQAGAAVTIMCPGGVGVAIPNGRKAEVYCDAVDYYTDTPTWTGDVLTLANNGDIVTKLQMSTAIATAGLPATAGTVLNSVADTTAGYLAQKVTLSLSGLTTTQVSGLSSLQISTKSPGANEKLEISAGQGYVGGFLNGGTKSAQFTPVIGTEYNCDLTASSWTVNVTGMTTLQIGQKFKINCFGNFQPFILGTFMGQTNAFLDPGFSGELTWSSTAWGLN